MGGSAQLIPFHLFLLHNTLSSRERQRFPCGWPAFILEAGIMYSRQFPGTRSCSPSPLPNLALALGPQPQLLPPRTPVLRWAPPPPTRAGFRAALTVPGAPHYEFSTYLKCSGVLTAPSSTFSLRNWFKPRADSVDLA